MYDTMLKLIERFWHGCILVFLLCCVRAQVLAEFCAQDEDGQTPLLFAARSGSGAVFRQALEALLARASPQKVCTYVCMHTTCDVTRPCVT